MRSLTKSAPTSIAVAMILSWPAMLGAQSSPGSPDVAHRGNGAAAGGATRTTVEVVAGPRYDAGTFRRWMLGEGHRSIWLTPIEVPVLDIGAIDGGLIPMEQGGGNQSITLHFENDQGREYIFRSVDKNLNQGLPADLQDTFVGDQVQDAISGLYPASALFVNRLLDSTDILHADPVLYLMPDDPRLGEFRETFAGMLGTLELTPNEGADDTPGTFGSSAIKGTEEFLEDLDSSAAHQLNARKFLKARLLDLVLNDTDRGGDQWRWARFDNGADRYLWEPIPRDRDWALVNAEGLLIRLARPVFPKVVALEGEYGSLEGLTVGAWELDRRLLGELDWATWEATVRELQNDLTGEAIAEALSALPAPWLEHSGSDIERILRRRRDGLGSVARDYYDLLALEVDVHGTSDAERVELIRDESGSVRLRIFRRDEADPYFDRLFLESETREVRLYLVDGDDHVLVTGPEGPGAVILRVVGGEGDDTLIDEGEPDDLTVRTAFYDDSGSNDIQPGSRTLVSDRTYSPPEMEANFVTERLQSEPRDWGGGSSIGPEFDYGDAAGLIIGASWTRERQGFRTQPYRYRAEATLLFGTASQNFGGELSYSIRETTHPVRVDYAIRGYQFESFRYFGLGNETPQPPDFQDATIVDQGLIEAEALAVLEIGTDTEIGVGPIVRFSRLMPRPGSVLDGDSRSIGRVGARLFGAFDRYSNVPGTGGFLLEGTVEAFPGTWDLDEALYTAAGRVEAQVPVPLGDWFRPTLALRAGGGHAWGDFPVDEGMYIGGRESLRGYRFSRFGGRSAVFGGAEVLVPVAQIELMTRGRLGVTGFVDVGRVWWDEDDPSVDGWHEGHGWGVFFETLGQFMVKASFATGEEKRFYLDFASPL